MNTSHYNLLLDIAGKSSGTQAPERAESLFKEMLAANLEPDISTYNAVIAAWGRSPRPEAELKGSVFDFDLALSHEDTKAMMAEMKRGRDKGTGFESKEKAGDGKEGTIVSSTEGQGVSGVKLTPDRG